MVNRVFHYSKPAYREKNVNIPQKHSRRTQICDSMVANAFSTDKNTIIRASEVEKRKS